MKHLALFEAFDKKLCGEWHSGSCTYYKAKTDFDTKKEAEEFNLNMQYEYYHNDQDRYKFKSCILSYDESQSKNVEEFFKNMI